MADGVPDECPLRGDRRCVGGPMWGRHTAKSIDLSKNEMEASVDGENWFDWCALDNCPHPYLRRKQIREKTGCPVCGSDEIRVFRTSDRGEIHLCLGCDTEVQPVIKDAKINVSWGGTDE
jgi:hypothetical protein